LHDSISVTAGPFRFAFMLNALSLVYYPKDRLAYITYRELPPGTFVARTVKISPELHGPAVALRMPQREKIAHPLGQLYPVYADYDVDGALLGIELLSDTPDVIAFVKNWCHEHRLAFPEF
jgi:hypothetical protein